MNQKQNDIKDINIKKISAQNLENLFYVFKTDDGQYFYNILKTVNFPDDIDPLLYTTYETVPNDTWPLIAYKHYKDVKLWWLICSLNQILDATKQPVPGTILKILNIDNVRDILNTLKDS